jgi:hypothetical protein
MGHPVTCPEILRGQARRKAAKSQAQLPGTFGLKMKPGDARSLGAAGSFATMQQDYKITVFVSGGSYVLDVTFAHGAGRTEKSLQ